ncbi:hypothetical protein PV682_14600 [Streptomyces niveiscabiei]|uniref:hypothetical protein n=1 Tax=Streptomyces niveiscabiei TaxID=164115 RepID=UPI0029BC1552|nr:hypothetical protein [Streptomyces niveiscabiei]MDX3382689.1 hypothetical protein [Streptomyces niveiscabiei]
MGFDGEIWRLRCGGEEVGTVTIDDADFPWLSGRFAPGPGYAAVEPLFTRELALLGEGWAEEWESAYDEIASRVSLSSPDGPVPEFLLHIEGERAWFRWSDEPFEEE